MKVLLDFTYSCCLIYIPDELANDKDTVKSLAQQFDKWLYDKNNDHGLWIYENNKKYAVSFDGSDFVNWINQEFLYQKNDKAEVLNDNYDDDHSKYLELYF